MNDKIPMPEVIPARPVQGGEEVRLKVGSQQGNNMAAMAAMVSPYAPRRQEEVSNTISEIKALMRVLLHREMRDLVKGIFEAHAKIQKSETATRSPSIGATELADVLDKFAFGD